ncbi:MAG: DNA replication and repair protein RecF [Candidatus Cloacimonetes bacterium]|nr:DNA replication and repair protein RecF [Candidatus Cloacimonadota bacterium]
MLLKSLELADFRNYNALRLDFDRLGAIISGDNGTGKTNLLEAVYYLAFGKSFRTALDSEIIRFDQNFFRIAGSFLHTEKKIVISAAADRNNKVFKVDNVSLARISELFKYFQTVYFSPADLQIITGNPGKRRLFLDQAISQYDAEYLVELRLFRQILRQRNALLKSRFQTSEKKSWDEQYLLSSRKVIEKRLTYLDEFIPLFKTYYAQLLQTREEVTILYTFGHNQKSPRFSVNEFQQQMTRLEKQEILLQRSLIGPHLDDLEFMINNRRARSFASQGQIRCLTIIARITQALLISRDQNDKPLLMFDDVLSELDNNRRNRILELLHGDHQVLIATPDLAAYNDLHLPIIPLRK